MLKQLIPLVFILLWIVPVGWVGLMRSNYPLYPAWIVPLFGVSSIFEKISNWWRIFFIKVQHKNANTTNMSRLIVASLNVTPSSHENP